MKRALNLGCGRMTMPRERPRHHLLIPDELYTDPDTIWTNVDKVALPGVDVTCDLFRYPWPIEDNSFEVCIAAHIIEHIPYAVWRDGVMVSLSDGWFAWWDELARVMAPDGIVYVLAPFAFSYSGAGDPTHQRNIVHSSFGYLAPSATDPFDYPLRYRWRQAEAMNVTFRDAAWNEAVAVSSGDETVARALLMAWQHQRLNVISELYIALQVVK